MGGRWICKVQPIPQRVWCSPSHNGPNLRTVVYPAFPDNPRLCGLSVWKLRELWPDGVNQLLISIIKPHRSAATTTMATWVMLELVSIFGAHSPRRALTSKAFILGARMEDILTADWSTNSTFKQFYLKPTDQFDSLVGSLKTSLIHPLVRTQN